METKDCVLGGDDTSEAHCTVQYLEKRLYITAPAPHISARTPIYPKLSIIEMGLFGFLIDKFSVFFFLVEAGLVCATNQAARKMGKHSI